MTSRTQKVYLHMVMRILKYHLKYQAMRQVEIFEHFGILDKHTTQKVISFTYLKYMSPVLTCSRTRNIS